MFRALRRADQVFFLSLFLYRVIVTTGSLLGGWPVWWFVALDPRHKLATSLATQPTYALLLWSPVGESRDPRNRILLSRDRRESPT